MPVRAEQYDQVCVLSVTGDFVDENVRAAERLCEEAIDKRQVVDFVVDLERCGFVDSEGLEALLGMKRRCEDLFGHLKLAGLDEHCRTILSVTRLEHRLQVHEHLESALKSIR
ncbi:MAG: STAS domain-containing protein [Phycisphaeraceae bacterium]|nr:STAS domain-containing protein [Phycisphaeraceae bacterium]